MMSAKMVALTFALLGSAAAQATCQGVGCKVDVPEDEVSLMQMKLETSHEVPPKVQKLQQEWQDFKADMDDAMANSTETQRVANGPATCWAMDACVCSGTAKTDPEKCSAKYDFGWCNTCGCKHCTSPPTAAAACADFDPNEYCRGAGGRQDTKKPYEPRVKGRGCLWCGCCDIMWQICSPVNEKLYASILAAYEGHGKNSQSNTYGTMGINKAHDYSKGKGDCQAAGTKRPHWANTGPDFILQ